MGVRKCVFASKAERTNFLKLDRAWGRRFRIWHNIPFLQVYTTESLISPKTLDPLFLDEISVQRLKKTSIDYVLCDKSDRPLVAIDFDGLANGFSAGSKYVPREPENALGWRRQITELKLLVGMASMWEHEAVTYIVVGANEFRDIKPNLKRTIVDGIIGFALAGKACREFFSEGFDPDYVGLAKEEFENLSDSEKTDEIGDWVMANEIAFEAEHSPFFPAIGRLRAELTKRGVFEVGFCPDYLSDPAIPSGLSPMSRIKAFDEALRHGVHYTLRYCLVKAGDTVTTSGGTLPEGCLSETEVVMVPNLHSCGVASTELASEIARCIIMRRLRDRYPVLVDA